MRVTSLLKQAPKKGFVIAGEFNLMVDEGEDIVLYLKPLEGDQDHNSDILDLKGHKVIKATPHAMGYRLVLKG